MMQEVLRQVISDAVWAPSGDNSQPWKFCIEENKIYVFNLPDRDHPYLNFQQGGSYIAHGALIENARIAAANRGYLTQVQLFPYSADSNLVARLTLEPSSQKHEFLYEAIFKRCTNRRPYKNTLLSSEQKNRLIDSVREVGNGTVRFIDTMRGMKPLAEAASVMERIALEIPYLHHLFFANILWTKKEEEMKKCGLYLKSLELPPPAQFLLHVLKRWSTMQILNKIGFSKIVAKGNSRIYTSSAAIGIIAEPAVTPINFIEAGRLMQRVWLCATAMGLSVQPITGVLFLAQRLFAGEDNLLSNFQKQLVKDAYRTVEQGFRLKQDVPILLFRIGYGDPPSARSSRLPPTVNEAS